MSVYYCIRKLHFIVANTSYSPGFPLSPQKNFLKNTLFHTLKTREILLFHLKNNIRLSLFPEKCQEPALALWAHWSFACNKLLLWTAELLNGWDETGVWSGILVMVLVFPTEIKATLCLLELFLPWDGHPNFTYDYLTKFCFCWLWTTPKNLALLIILWN